MLLIAIILGLILGQHIKITISPDALALATKAYATIAAKLPVAVKIGKSAFYDQAQLSTAEAYAYTSAVMVENMMVRDTDEGITAFLEKRAPDWSSSEPVNSRKRDLT
jgi:enoyl-CoA hydratase/carnithine racemase